MPNIDLNCDMGETTRLHDYDIAVDLEILKYVSSVNLACGFHAGDPHTMHALVKSALENGKAIGAHPAFPDLANFGRINMSLSPEMIYDIVLYQLGSLDAFVKVQGAGLHHVKPHGALYNMAATDPLVADAICKAVKDFDGRILLYGLSGSELLTAARRIGLKAISEVFADRTYLENGTLTPRTASNALIEDMDATVRQVLQMIRKGSVITTGGIEIGVIAETICIHGDGRSALAFAKTIHEILKQNHVGIQQP